MIPSFESYESSQLAGSEGLIFFTTTWIMGVQNAWQRQSHGYRVPGTAIIAPVP